MVLTNVEKDKKGIYVICDRWIARPTGTYFDIYGETKFKEGSLISATHPAGNSVFVKEKRGREYKPELWETDGTSTENYYYCKSCFNFTFHDTKGRCENTKTFGD